MSTVIPRLEQRRRSEAKKTDVDIIIISLMIHVRSIIK